MSIEEVSDIVAKKMGKSPVLVNLINRMQYKYLLEIMQSGEFEGLSFIYLGKFVKNDKCDENGKFITKKQHADNIKNRKRLVQ